MSQISLKYILLDRAMVEQIKQNTHEKAKHLKLKILPPDVDKSVGFLHPMKITSIENTYFGEVNTSSMPDIVVQKYGKSNYYSVVDGRHRVVVAIRNGQDSISATFLDDNNYE